MKWMGREAEASRLDTLPEARRIVRFPALRFLAALLFLLPGGLLLLVGLALIQPWLRRLSTASDRVPLGANERHERSQPYRPDEREPSAQAPDAQQILRAQVEERLSQLEMDPWDDPRGFDRTWTPGKWGES